VVQGTLMRVTIHLVSPGDYRPFAAAVREARRTLWLRAWKEPDDAAMTEAAGTLRAALAGGRALPRKEVEALIGKDATRGIHLWLDLVRVPPSGTWERRRADLYAAAADWLGPPPDEVDETAGRELLVRRYLTAFGPATRKDVASWAGLKPAELEPAFANVKLRQFESEDGDELIDVPRAPLPPADTPAPVRFLPTWDATLLVHARRAGILREGDRPRIFSTRNPHSSPTFLVDGVVAGTWTGTGAYELFAPVTRTQKAEVADEAARLKAWLG